MYEFLPLFRLCLCTGLKGVALSDLPGARWEVTNKVCGVVRFLCAEPAGVWRCSFLVCRACCLTV